MCFPILGCEGVPIIVQASWSQKCRSITDYCKLFKWVCYEVILLMCSYPLDGALFTYARIEIKWGGFLSATFYNLNIGF